MTPALADDIQRYRDRTWRRTEDLRVETAQEAERFVETLGFCFTLTDARHPGPSLYVAVCGRREAFMPRNVQKDPEASLAWTLKDEVMRRSRVYYAKLVRGRSTFVATGLIPHFNAVWGIGRSAESRALSPEARAILKVLRREWEMATKDLRKAARVDERVRFNRAIDELQRRMKVVPGEVVYSPFSYIWTLAEARFPREMAARVARQTALREVARCYLKGAGRTLRGELSKVTGLSRRDAGLGNHALVDEGFAERLDAGVYSLASLDVCSAAAD